MINQLNNSNGTVTLNGGSLYFGSLIGNPVIWNSGTLTEPVVNTTITVGTGQTFSAPTTSVTVAANGSIIVNSGGVIAGNLTSSGMLTFNAGFVVGSGNLAPGQTYNQTGGNTTITGTFGVGNDGTLTGGGTNSNGSASITGGSLYADTVILGNSNGGSGALTVSGTASVTVGGGLNFNDLTLNGGSLTVLNQNPPAGEDPNLNRAMVGGYLRNGAFNITGGTATSPYIKLGISSGSTCTFNQTGGTVNVTTAFGVGNDGTYYGGSGTALPTSAPAPPTRRA